MPLYNRDTPPNIQTGSATATIVQLPNSKGWAWKHLKGNGHFWLEDIVVFADHAAALPPPPPPPPPPLSVALSPATLTLNRNGAGSLSTNLLATPAGGAGGYTYILDGGGMTVTGGNTTTPGVSISLNAGDDVTFTITEQITDALGAHASDHATIRCIAALSPPPPPPGNGLLSYHSSNMLTPWVL